ncbi:MAG: hypothetical protein KBE27_06325 [Syntrophorhabdaceae bacterium]|nr:hypothetical protein [Syntrophorhabdaceae bacterium]
MNILTKYLLKDIRLKLLALILAILFWFAVSYTGDTKMTVSIPVTFENVAKQYIVKNIEPDHVLLSISGPVSVMKGMRLRDIKIILNLGSIKEGRYVLNISRDNINLPHGIKVETIKPDYINVDVDGVIEKRMKPIVKLDKKWVGIYRIKSWSPQYVLVEGSKESLRNRETIETQIIDSNFLHEVEEIDVGFDTKGMIVRRIRPDTIRVILKRM